jgi:amidohydrolase
MRGRRRHYHAHPEVSGEELRTADAVEADLRSLGLDVTRPLPHAIVATVRGTTGDAYDTTGEPRRRLLMRADIDALPVTEETGLPFSSENPGVMHACGHDCHIATLLGVARVLLGMTDELHGEARLVFEPAEETGTGAAGLVDAGVLEGVDGAYAEHVWNEVEPGTVSVEAGPRMAAVDWWRADVYGESAHGAMPEAGADAIVAAAAAVGALQDVVARETSPFEPVVVTTGRIEGGTARNLICDHAWLEGTCRCFSPTTRDELPTLMRRAVEGAASEVGCTARVEWLAGGHGPVVNDEVASAMAERSARAMLGDEAISRYAGTMAGEDFSNVLERVGGLLAFVGSGTADPTGRIWPQHSSHYSPDESILLRGCLLASRYAVDFLAG